MSDPESQKMPKPGDIEARLNFFEESNRWTLEALGMVSSLSDFPATLHGRESRQNPEDILADTRVRLKRLFPVEATAFFNRYDDLIVSVGQSFQDASQFRTDNLDNSRARGLELAVTARTAQGFEARVTYTWPDTEVLALDAADGQAKAGFAVGDPLLRRPRHQGSLELSFTQSRFSVFTSLGARSRTRDIDPTFGTFGGLFDNPSYAVVDIGGSLRATTALKFTARIQNLLDNDYEEAFGFPALGRSFIAGIRVTTR